MRRNYTQSQPDAGALMTASCASRDRKQCNEIRESHSPQLFQLHYDGCIHQSTHTHGVVRDEAVRRERYKRMTSRGSVFLAAGLCATGSRFPSCAAFAARPAHNAAFRSPAAFHTGTSAPIRSRAHRVASTVDVERMSSNVAETTWAASEVCTNIGFVRSQRAI